VEWGCQHCSAHPPPRGAAVDPRMTRRALLLPLMALPPLYAALSVRVEGRIVWSLYPCLIPFAVALGLPRRAETAPDVRPLKTSRRA